MNWPTDADRRASRNGGFKVAVLAALGLIIMVAAWRAGHNETAVLAAAVTIIGVLMEGRPKARRARERWGR